MKQKTTDRRVQMQEKQKPSKVPSFTSGLGLANVVFGALFAARKSVFLISTFPVCSASLPQQFRSVQFKMVFPMRLEVFPTFALETVSVFNWLVMAHSCLSWKIVERCLFLQVINGVFSSNTVSYMWFEQWTRCLPVICWIVFHSPLSMTYQVSKSI